MVVPSVVAPNQTFTAYLAPPAIQVPKAESTPLGAATLNDAYGLSVIAPVPAGMTVQSLSVEGGDATTADQGVVTSCPVPTASQPAGCTAKYSGNYVDSAGSPYVARPAVERAHHRGRRRDPADRRRDLQGHGRCRYRLPRHAHRVRPHHFGGGPDLRNNGGDLRRLPTSGNSGTPPVAAATPLSTTTIESPQSVGFTSTPPTGQTAGGATYTPTASATSGLTPVITVDTSASSVCSITGGVVSFLAVGNCVLDANQPGNGSYQAASQVQQTIAVSQGEPVDQLHFLGPGGHGGWRALRPDGDGLVGAGREPLR